MKQGYSEPGFVIKIDKEYHGARQAFKVKKVERGKCVRSNMVDIIAPTKEGIRDRVLILWPDEGYGYEESHKLEVISSS